MVEIKFKLFDLLEKATEALNLPVISPQLEHPANTNFGDYSTNLALTLYPQVKDRFPAPLSLAEAIQNQISQNTSDPDIQSITVAKPGFINFKLNPTYFLLEAQAIVADQWIKPLKGKKVAVEYTDPNPFKEFHIGHLYSNIIGESISRLYEACGATVWRGDFYGDVGMHIAKSVWGLIQIMDKDHLDLADLDKLPLKERQNLLGQGYAHGVVQFDASETVKTEVTKINSLIYAASQAELQVTRNIKPSRDFSGLISSNQDYYSKVHNLYKAGLTWSLAYFETYYQRLGTKFDGYYPESWVGEIGLELVEKGLASGVLEMSEGGSVIYRGEKDGLHTRVFRNHLGLPTYEAKDLGLVQAKYHDFPFDLSINVFGKEIDEYYKVVKKVMEKIIPDLGIKQFHLAHGMVNLPTGKMSSRSGNVITVEWLLNHARDLALNLIENKDLKPSEKATVAEQVGQAAIKYTLLMSNIGDNVTFDFAKSVTFQGNSGPYLQYTYARCCSVLAKKPFKSDDIDLSRINLQPAESSLLSLFCRYPEIVVKSTNTHAPHLLCTYLYDLAQIFNSFYNRYTILGSKTQPTDPYTQSFRLFLTKATAKILKNGLSILGISAPEQM